MSNNCNNYEQFEVELPILFTKLSKMFNKGYSDFLKPYDLSKLHAFYLLCLLKHPEGMKIKQICDELDCDKANTSRALIDLEKRGVVTKSSHKDGEKKYDIKLTDYGVDIACKFQRYVEECVELSLRALTQDDINQLLIIIKKLIDFNDGRVI